MASKPPSRRIHVACEFSPERVVAARAADSGDIVELCTAQNLPAGSIVPSLTGDNVAKRDEVRDALRYSLEALGSRSRDIIAVLPDAACRVALLDFDSLPGKPQEAEGVIRFRLKKSLPFDVDRARVSYQVQSENGKLNVIATIALTSVIEEYESVLREAGYNPGVVLPSMLAALGQVDASHPTLVIKVDALTTSVAIVDRDQLLLTRTLENPAGINVDGEQLAEDIYPSLVFFQDTYGLKIDTVLVGGLASLDRLSSTLRAQGGMRVQELVSVTRLPMAAPGAPRPFLAGVVGALVS
ncbi:MAG: type IV pilus biogenesis protein PilM [Terriglobales bacterium]